MKKRRRTGILLCSVILAAACVLHAAAYPVPAPEGFVPPAESTLLQMDAVTEDADVLVMGADYEISPTLQTLLEDAIAAFESGGRDVSFVLVDIATGAGLCYKPNRPCYSASAVKAPFVFALLEAGIAPTRDMYQAGQHSDNQAYRALRRTYGLEVFGDYLEASHVDRAKMRYNFPWDITSLDLAKTWYRAYVTLFSDPEISEWLWDTFGGSFHSVIGDRLGGVYKTASKAGWITYPSRSASVYNDAGIIDDGEHPYVVAVTARTPDGIGYQNAEELIPVLNLIHHEMLRLLQES